MCAWPGVYKHGVGIEAVWMHVAAILREPSRQEEEGAVLASQEPGKVFERAHQVCIYAAGRRGYHAEYSCA